MKHQIKILSTLIAFLIISFFAYYTQNLKLDASSDTLILKNDKTFKYFEYYNEIFPSRKFLVLAVKSDVEIDKKYINNINKIVEKINGIENVESTFSIVDVPILLLNNLNLSDLANQEIETINNTKNNLKLILNEFSSSPIFRNQIINPQKNISAIIIYAKKNLNFENLKKIRKNKKEENKYQLEKKKYNDEKEELIKVIRNVLNDANINYEYFLGGIDMIASDTINFVKNDILIFSVAVIFFIIILLLIIFKEIKWVIIPLVTTLYSVITMTGVIGFMDWEITAISSNFISLMLILSISMNIHIINNYKINYFDTQIQNKLLSTIKQMFRPCIYTTLTTIVAFTSLLFSNIKPLIDFGSIMIIGLLIIFFTSFTILPLLIYYFPKNNKMKKLKFTILNNFYNIAIKHTRNIMMINLIVFIVSIFGIYKLNVENSFINYFKSDTQIYKGMKLIDTQLGGTTPIDIVIKFDDEQIIKNEDEMIINDESIDEDLDIDFGEEIFTTEDYNEVWFSKDRVNTIKKIHMFMKERAEIGKVQSLYSIIEMANLINKSPLSIFEISVLYNEIPTDYKESLINPYLSIDNNMVKISARVKDSYEIKRAELIADIKNFLKTDFENINTFEVNGLLVLYNNMLQSLFSSQIKSFGIILVSIFCMFLILFKSIKISIIGIVPNIIASTFILGIIGILKIPLDIMTITIAAITIGIAVDNTIHYLYRINENKKIFSIKTDLIKKTQENVGTAVLITSLTISFGFLVLCLSNFIPTILFGIFTALAMIIAMIGVLITLPSLINRF